MGYAYPNTVSALPRSFGESSFHSGWRGETFACETETRGRSTMKVCTLASAPVTAA